MPVTSTDVVNRALAQISSQSQITALTDQTPEGIAASTLYTSVVQLLLRDMDPEFARKNIALSPSIAPASQPWTLSYIYPADCLRLRQVMPSAPSANDPQPVRWSVQDDAGNIKAIMTNQANARIIYTTSSVTENQWDATFTEAAVRMLASELAMPIGGRPDFAKQKLAEAGQLMTSDAGRDS